MRTDTRGWHRGIRTALTARPAFVFALATGSARALTLRGCNGEVNA